MANFESDSSAAAGVQRHLSIFRHRLALFARSFGSMNGIFWSDHDSDAMNGQLDRFREDLRDKFVARTLYLSF